MLIMYAKSIGLTPKTLTSAGLPVFRHAVAAVLAAGCLFFFFAVGHGVCGDFIVQQFPEGVFTYQAAGSDLAAAAAAHFGDEAHARAGYLLRAHFLRRVHALAFGVGGVVEGAHAGGTRGRPVSWRWCRCPRGGRWSRQRDTTCRWPSFVSS